ncbi:type II toxin-antitoxin system VapC family toxin [Candidatus Magnetominusculus xianensis]|nr:type II toxin-antitoxin system VapC family toxin [Candidatus Magnetominusculus xianensis]MBF0402415.1 type II toxin-antitoxin system VapC family toxin [Nitrospirota bacterium]
MELTLIDTDVAIDYLRGQPYAKEAIEGLWVANTACLSVLSVYELHVGMKDNERFSTESFIEACHIEPVGHDVAIKAGEIYKKYRTKGITLTPIDCLIYATAILKKYKIATRNLKHYPDGDTLFSACLRL